MFLFKLSNYMKKKYIWKTTSFIITIIFLLSGLLVFISSSSTNLECTKDSNYQAQCVFTKMLAMELIQDEKLFINPLQSGILENKLIQKEEPSYPPSYKNIYIYRVALKNSHIPINDFSDNLKVQQTTFSKINNFIQNKNQFSLIIKENNFLSLGILGIAMIIIGIMIAITTFS
jgi:hypothetical protein